MDTSIGRRKLLTRALAAIGTLGLAGCDSVSDSDWMQNLLASAENLDRAIQKLLVSRRALAPEYTAADISSVFKPNGTLDPGTPEYEAMAAKNFAEYRLEVSGLVKNPGKFSLAELRELPSRTQITRHDCVEGWSVIGKWKGVRLSALLDKVGLQPQARYLAFRCADLMAEQPYYESIDLEDAMHEQTILAYDMNDQPVPVSNGAPLRLRVERQLGYKMAKYVMKIEVVERFEDIGGKGGFWEDQGYAWYGGI